MIEIENTTKMQLERLTEEIDAIKCAICKNCLSIAPIASHEALGNVCGRANCQKFANSRGKSFRQSAYESVAKFLDFPCCHVNEGCKKRIPWNSVEEHEKHCEFSKMQCPLSMEKFEHENGGVCAWIGDTQNCLNHLEDKHPSYRFTGSVPIKFESDFKNKFVFSKMGNDVVILLISIDQNSLYLKVWTGPENLGIIKYNVEVSSEEGKVVTASELQYAELINGSFFKTPMDSSWFVLNFNSIKSLFKNPSMITTNFYNNDIIVVDPLQSLLPKPSNPMFEDIKCDICNKGVVEYIYFCRNLHNCCENCKISVKQETITFRNSSAKSNPTRTSNSTNNSLDEDLTCPFCKTVGLFRNSVFQSLKAVAHQSMKSCKLCGMRVESLSSHFKETHWGDIFPLHKKIPFNVIQCLFFYDAHAFLLQKTFSSNGALSFSVEALGTPNINYKYELQLISSKTSHSAVTFSDICFPEDMYTKQVFGKDEAFSHSTIVPLELLSKISSEIKSIEFTLNITKLKY